MLDLIGKIRALILKLAGALDWLPATLARLCVGWVFLESGWGKVHDLGRVTEFFRSLGIPAPELQAPLASYTELVCGALLLAGLFTRLASVPLIVTMAVAILTAKKAELTGVSVLYGFIEYLYILLMIYLGVKGPGPLSIDYLLVRQLVEKEEAGTAPSGVTATA